jgi:hypothetical protein
LTDIDELYHYYVEIYDNALNYNRTNTYYVIIDHTPPTITNVQPPDGAIYFTDNISFNWTVQDNLFSNVTCHLEISSNKDLNNVTINSTVLTNYSLAADNLSLGAHYWNVTCWDGLFNTNYSETRLVYANVFTTLTVRTKQPFSYVYSTITFYANYSAGLGILNQSNCTIYYDDLQNDSMIFNQSLSLYESKHFFTTPANHTYIVNCSQYPYQNNTNTSSIIVYTKYNLTTAFRMVSEDINMYNVSLLLINNRPYNEYNISVHGFIDNLSIGFAYVPIYNYSILVSGNYKGNVSRWDVPVLTTNYYYTYKFNTTNNSLVVNNVLLSN